MPTPTTISFNKVLRLGTIPESGSVYVNIKWDGSRLSLTGVEGPQRNGACKGSAGQITLDPHAFTSFAPKWDAAQVQTLATIWKRWHLNDMRAGCEHQRTEGWDQRPIDSSKPLTAYGKHFPDQRTDSWNMLVWVRRDEHPEGLLAHPCLICGYKYGTAWLHEDVPANVLDWLRQLPDTDKEPAWI